MDNVEAVREIYEAFGRGDVAAILDRLADDVEWDHYEYGNAAQDAGLPYLQARRGPGEVAEFFAAVAENLEFSHFEPAAMLAGDGYVAAVVREEATNIKTGKGFADTAIHLWRFGDDGRVAGLHHLIDTAKHIAAATEA